MAEAGKASLFDLPYQDEDRAVLLCILYNTFPWGLGPGDIAMFSCPTMKQEFDALLAQKMVTEDALAKDIITEKELITVALAEGTWTEEKEEEYTGLYSSIRSPRLSGEERQSLTARYIELLNERWGLTDNSAERLGLRAKNRRLLEGCVMQVNGRPITDIPDKIEAQFQSFIDWTNGIHTRGLAKQHHAKQLWAVSGGDAQCFLGGPLASWTQLQMDLVGWLKFYDSIYQNMECPPDDVVEDDSALDSWAEKQRKEGNRLRRERYHQKKGHTGRIVGLNKSEMPKDEGAVHLADHLKMNQGVIGKQKDLSLWDNPEAFDKLGLVDITGSGKGAGEE